MDRTILLLAMASGPLAWAAPPSTVRQADLDTVNPRGGTVLRMPGFDVRKGGADWAGNGRWAMVREKGFEGRDCYRYQIRDKRYMPFKDWSATTTHTLGMKPNRDYVVSVLLNADFDRPTEVNLGLKGIDAAGQQVMWNLNGLPNRTKGWRRWEWRFTADPRVTHGVFSMLVFSMPADGKLRIADIAFVELPPTRPKPFAVGQGATFRGGPGKLPMRVESAEAADGRITVVTTGARYVFDTNRSEIRAEQRIERSREAAVWESSLPLTELKVLRHNAVDCVLANENVTFGIQCDSLVMVVPHRELVLTCRSRIGGKWNRLANGHLLVVDDHGGFAANPAAPLGSGRVARVHVGRHYAGIQPGRIRPGAVDFANTAGDQTFLSRAKPGWEMTWSLSPSERIGISVFPPRPFPWRESFEFSWLLANRRDNPAGYAARKRGPGHVEVLWDFIQRSWAMSWGPRHVPYDESVLRKHVAAIRKVGARSAVYMSPHWYYSRDAAEFAAEVRRLRETYGIDGVYYDGIPSQEWLVAYEVMRLTRQAVPDGPIIVHNTGQPYNGNPPLGEPAIRIPAVETYATATYGGELVHGEGTDWPFLWYSASQYRKANCISVMKGDAWIGPSSKEKALTMLALNARCQYRKYPAEYYAALRKLQGLWEEHSDSPVFYEKHYRPYMDALLRQPGKEKP